ncbi:uncharacterized protein LOC113562022 isoform X1 [Ooceraea biroi]|uniref:uncharacterized protein LOC113562022 isoform X1 n=1 Tax=Ooceraea biroi TaxID=2015173 RepID=UPI000F07B76D|nr:uncharacterized protein LOC113562022 isoform X1 [Ooceraea biroi]
MRDLHVFKRTQLQKSKMKCVIFTIFLIIAMAMAAPQGEKQPSCSPMYGRCQVFEDCCRYLQCLSYSAKCIPIQGLIVPGKDQRPLGPGPYPPNVPLD